MLLFLKFGGSLITDKHRPMTPLPERIAALAEAIAQARAREPQLRLVLGHGSGSFGHAVAQRHGTRQGVRDAEGWQGFAAVWHAAAQLNRLVVDALHQAGLPAVAFPPSAGVIAENGRISTWDLRPLQAALEAGLLPVVYGDVAFDTVRGGTIVSTEEVFAYLAEVLRPKRIFIAGVEPGVWADYPHCTRLVPEITPQTLESLGIALQGSAAADVTGGMAAKVRDMLALAEQIPGLEILIFGGTPPRVRDALLGKPVPGTWLRGTSPKGSPGHSPP